MGLFHQCKEVPVCQVDGGAFLTPEGSLLAGIPAGLSVLLPDAFPVLDHDPPWEVLCDSLPVLLETALPGDLDGAYPGVPFLVRFPEDLLPVSGKGIVVPLHNGFL